MYNDSTRHAKLSQKRILKLFLIKNFMTGLWLGGKLKTIEFRPSVDKSVSEDGIFKR